MFNQTGLGLASRLAAYRLRLAVLFSISLSLYLARIPLYFLICAQTCFTIQWYQCEIILLTSLIDYMYTYLYQYHSLYYFQHPPS